jgi:hypothetical protein
METTPPRHQASKKMKHEGGVAKNGSAFAAAAALLFMAYYISDFSQGVPQAFTNYNNGNMLNPRLQTQDRFSETAGATCPHLQISVACALL